MYMSTRNAVPALQIQNMYNEYMLPNKSTKKVSLAKKAVKAAAKKVSKKVTKKAPGSEIITSGIKTAYHNNGSKWGRGKVVAGKMEGKWQWWRKDGTIMRSGHFKKGEQTGVWTTYDKDGKAYKVTKMK